MKITPTNVISSGVQVIMTLAFGFFILVTAFFMVSESLDAKKNMTQVERLNVTDTGRVHVYDGYDFTVGSGYGTPRKCVALVPDSTNIPIMQDTTVAVPGSAVIPSNFCNDAILKYVPNWEQYASNRPTSFMELVFMTVITLIVLLAGGYFIMQIPALVVSLLYTPAFQYAKIITVVFMLPIFIFISIFVYSMWSYEPGHWFTPNDHTVKTSSVYITSDGSLYKAPETLYDWTESETGDKLTERIR